MILRWLLGRDDLGYLPHWNAVLADRYAEATARMLLGWAGPARVELSAAQRARRREQAHYMVVRHG